MKTSGYVVGRFTRNKVFHTYLYQNKFFARYQTFCTYGHNASTKLIKNSKFSRLIVFFVKVLNVLRFIGPNVWLIPVNLKITTSSRLLHFGSNLKLRSRVPWGRYFKHFVWIHHMLEMGQCDLQKVTFSSLKRCVSSCACGQVWFLGKEGIVTFRLI